MGDIMFESIKHWLESLQEGGKLFDNREDETLHRALASVLYHIVVLDNKVSGREKRMFSDLLKCELDLNNDQIEHLFEMVKASSSEWLSDLHVVNNFLKGNPTLRMNFMRKLLQLIDVDGIQAGELKAFYEALHEVFPEIRPQ